MSAVDLKDWREMLGLAGTGADELPGLRRFLRFTEAELTGLSMMPAIPESVQQQIGSIAAEMRRTLIFVDGYLACVRGAVNAEPRESLDGQ